ncbi:MAG TPA: ferritin-like domain-containing protein [Bryobacteraceae bacterium]|nr:ferritin-like domain-containing protein [Bryobacteraceae bacterium]
MKKVHITMMHKTRRATAGDLEARWRDVVKRRSFLAGLATTGAALSTGNLIAKDNRRLGKGDVAIIKFLAAAELVESDFWQQYNELGGVSGGNAAYKLALQNLDGDMPQYIADNTDDEMSHAAFLNAYLMSKGEPPVNLDAFRTLHSSQATGAKRIGRLTNLMNLNVDTSWYTRYRSTKNPDLAGGAFPQAVNITNQPTIPIDDQDTPPNQSQPVPPATSQQQRMQAIANAAGFHFAAFDQAGSSVYTNLILNVSDREVLRVLVSILGVEVNHFAVWHDKAGNAVSQPLAGVKDPETGVTFPDLNSPPFGGEAFQTNLIFPEPCAFINPGFPDCAVIRPSLKENAGAVATATAIVNSQLFQGQSQAFFNAVTALAVAADAARPDHSGDD